MSIRKEVMYELLENLGGEEVSSHMVLMELIKWLDADTVVEFTDDFKRLNNVLGYEQYEMCSTCQETHDENEEHSCDEEKLTLIRAANRRRVQ